MRKTLRSSDQQIFLELLRSARKKAGLTQAALAERLHKPQSFVAKYEKGERRIDVTEFVDLARALDADPVALLRKFVKAVSRAGEPDPASSVRPRNAPTASKRSVR
jgi:transcriptional regulator with XRE-family HTH domain